MSKIIETKINISLFVISMIAAVFLGLFGVIFGNDVIPEPNLLKYKEQVEKEKISNCDLARWIEEGKRSFFLVGFRRPEDFKGNCRIKTSSCNDEKKLNDIKWLRMRFPNLKIPLIIYGEDNEKSLDATAKMRYYGYNAYMLEGGYKKFVKDFINLPSKDTKLCKDEKNDFSLRMARHIYFSGKDKNLGKKKKTNYSAVPKGLKKKPSFSIEGC